MATSRRKRGNRQSSGKVRGQNHASYSSTLQTMRRLNNDCSLDEEEQEEELGGNELQNTVDTPPRMSARGRNNDVIGNRSDENSRRLGENMNATPAAGEARYSGQLGGTGPVGVTPGSVIAIRKIHDDGRATRSPLSGQKTENEVIKSLVKRNIFPKVKMIGDMEQLEWDGGIAKILFRELSMEELPSDEKKAWLNHRRKSMIRKSISVRRNNITTSMKKVFYGKHSLCTGL